MSINRAIIIGNLGADPEVNTTDSGLSVCNFRMAVNEVRGKGDEKKEFTSWFRIVCYSNLADICGENLTKGQRVGVDGRLRQRNWEDRDGNKRETVEIIANEVQFLSPKNDE